MWASTPGSIAGDLFEALPEDLGIDLGGWSVKPPGRLSAATGLLPRSSQHRKLMKYICQLLHSFCQTPGGQHEDSP